MSGPYDRTLVGSTCSRVVGAALAGARAFLIEPADPLDVQAPAAPDSHPVIAVFGLARGCGATVVSRALAAELARRDAGGASAVACESRAAGPALATHAASRLARTLQDLPGGTRALGRLCLLRAGDPPGVADALRGLAPLVIDAGSVSLGGVPACVADRTVVVTTPALEPALARVAAECIARVAPEPVLVVNRASGGASAKGTSGALRLPASRMGAQLALGGREARGELGRAVSELADRCERGA